MANNKNGQETVIYTKEQLLARKLSEAKIKASLINSLCDIMFQAVGHTFEWAKAHDKDDLHIVDLVPMTWEQYVPFRKDLVAIIMRQGRFGKRSAENEADKFMLACGLPRLNNQDFEEKYRITEDKFKENLRFRIKQYEDNNGPLTYDDGWEKELKEYAEYNVEHKS